jgi:glycosyltransferase involved in cell wall biosynthesis
MRILFLITGLEMGGAEQVVIHLADALASKGHEIRIAYMTGLAVVFPKNPNIQLINIAMSSKVGVVSALFKLRKLLRGFQPDVVHSHMVHANILARLVRLVTPVPRLICTAHSSNEGGKLRMLAYRLTDGLADISTNVSEAAVEAFIKAKAVRPGRMVALHNGVALNAFAFNVDARMRVRQALLVDEDCRLLLAVGRLHESKDYPNLFNSLALLPADHNYRLCIAGDGPLRKHLQALVHDSGLADHVSFLGVRRDIADLMSAADVFVLSSAWEGFPMVVMEAMASERVLVVTDCGGVREAVGDAGFLVKPKDAKALAHALQTALQLGASESANMGRAARQRIAEKFSLDVTVEKWLRLYAGPVSLG